jgi:two-component system alkaline phosphatase synthesis response regulator PhoP
MTNTKRKVLLIDDDEFSQRLFQTVLKHTNVQFIGASNQTDALEMVAREGFDLIVVDIMLPDGKDGFNLLHVLRTEYEITCPILAITAYYNDDTRAQFQQVGFNGWLLKPFQLESLLSYLSQFLQ